MSKLVSILVIGAMCLGGIVTFTPDAFADPPAAAPKADAGARLVPTVANGKPVGLKIYAIRPGSRWERGGLQNGDLIETADGKPVATAEDAAALSKEAEVKLTATRKGAALHLTLPAR